MKLEFLRRIFFRRLDGNEIKSSLLSALRRVQEEPGDYESRSHTIITNMYIKSSTKSLELQLFATYSLSALSALQAGDKDKAKAEFKKAKAIRKFAIERDGEYSELAKDEASDFVKAMHKKLR